MENIILAAVLNPFVGDYLARPMSFPFRKISEMIISKKFILGGMKPKITTCIKALGQGVKQATILDGRIPHALILELFTEHGIGTQIYT